MLIDYHCDYSHNRCVRSNELGLESGALSDLVEWKCSSSDVSGAFLLLLMPSA